MGDITFKEKADAASTAPPAAVIKSTILFASSDPDRYSTPALRSSDITRINATSTCGGRDRSRVRALLTCTYRSSERRNATLGDPGRPPGTVLIGPFSTTPASRMACTTSAGTISASPCARARMPIWRSSHSTRDTRRVEDLTGGMHELGSDSVPGQDDDMMGSGHAGVDHPRLDGSGRR